MDNSFLKILDKFDINVKLLIIPTKSDFLDEGCRSAVRRHDTVLWHEDHTFQLCLIPTETTHTSNYTKGFKHVAHKDVLCGLQCFSGIFK